MAFTKIKNFLEKFSFISPPERLVEKEVESFLEHSLNFSRDRCRIRFKQPIIFIAAPDAAAKNELFLKQEELLNLMREKFPSGCFQGIRFKGRI